MQNAFGIGKGGDSKRFACVGVENIAGAGHAVGVRDTRGGEAERRGLGLREREIVVVGRALRRV